MTKTTPPNPSTDRRDELILGHLALIDAAARRVHRRLPAHVDYGDLRQDAAVGLTQAARDYAPSRGRPFPHYAAKRVRGEIHDGMHALDPVPRLARDRAAACVRAAAPILAATGRPPTDDELAAALVPYASDRLGTPAAILADRDLGSRPSTADALSQAEGGRLQHRMSARPADDAGLVADIRQAIRRACHNRAQRLLVACYFFGNCTMAECAAAIGRNESRCSQMLGEILPRMAADPALRALAGAAGSPATPLRSARDIRFLIHETNGRPAHKPNQARWLSQGRLRRLRQGRPRTDAEGATPGQPARPRPAQDGPASLPLTDPNPQPGPQGPREEAATRRAARSRAAGL